MSDFNDLDVILGRTDLGIAIYDKNAKPLFCNKLFLSQTQKQLENFKLTGFTEFYNSSQTFKSLYKECKDGIITSIDNEWSNNLQLEIGVQYLPDSGNLAFLTKRKAINSQNDFEQEIDHCNLIEEAADSFFIITKDYKIFNANLSACKLTGYSKEELTNLYYSSLFSSEELKNKPFEFQAVESNKTVVNERKLLCKNGSTVNIEMRTKKLSDGNILSIVRDITTRIIIRTQLETKNQELERAYNQVIESEKKYRQLFKNIPLGIFTATAEGKIESINIQMAEMLGSDSAERSSKFNLFELPTLKGTRFIEDFKLAIEEGVSHHKVYDYTSLWNKKTSLRAHILPLDSEGERKALVIVEDYSKEREKENRLRILSQGVNNSPASIVVTDAQGKIKFVNKSFMDITGYSMNELLDRTPEILKSGYHPPEFYKNLWSIILEGKEWVGEFRNKKKNGELFWESAMISALKDEKGRITNFMAIKEDITHKKLVEKELKDKTEQLLNLVNYTPDNICFKEADGTWILANAATLDFYGLKDVHYQGKTNQELANYCKKDVELLLLDLKSDAETWEKGSLNQFETKGTDNEGSQVVMEVVKLPLFHADGSKKGIINIGRDITRRKVYEKELQIAKEKAEEADMLKSAFLANMSHEIRTPLNAIMGFSSLMADYSLDKDSIVRFVEIIQVNGKQLLTIIDDILLIAKLQVNQIRVQTALFDLDQILLKLHQQYLKELEISKEKKIELNISRNIMASIKIKTDRDKFNTIFSKLIRNAVKFSSKGRIDFGYELGKNNTLTFFVKDTGMGISVEKQKLIFQKFRQVDDSTTREYGGTGLGLSIVQGLIELLNGKIWFQSELDKGTTFYFTIPLESLEVEKMQEVEKKPTTDWANKKVLIVDDVHESIFLLREMLKRTGIEIYSATTGIEAVEQFTNNPGIDIVLMDIQLPEMSGLEAADKIKQINPEVAIIMQTAFGQDGYEQKSKEAGCDDIIYKPISFDALIKKMNRFL